MAEKSSWEGHETEGGISSGCFYLLVRTFEFYYQYQFIFDYKECVSWSLTTFASCMRGPQNIGRETPYPEVTALLSSSVQIQGYRNRIYHGHFFFHIYFRVTTYSHSTIWHNVTNAVKKYYKITHESISFVAWIFGYLKIFQLRELRNVTWLMKMNGEQTWLWKVGIAA